MLIDWLRSAEFRISPDTARVWLRLARARFDPYRPEYDARHAIFVHVPKTAGTSVCRALFDVKPRHAPLARFLAIDPDRFARYFKFGFVRNPWDRLFSAYSFLSGTPRRQFRTVVERQWVQRRLGATPTFEQFVLSLEDRRRREAFFSRKHFRPQRDWLRVPGHPDAGCDFIGRFESLAEDFEVVCRRLGVAPSLPALRQTAHAPYREVYSRDMIVRVGEWYAEDISLYGYRFDGRR